MLQDSSMHEELLLKKIFQKCNKEDNFINKEVVDTQISLNAFFKHLIKISVFSSADKENILTLVKAWKDYHDDLPAKIAMRIKQH